MQPNNEHLIRTKNVLFKMYLKCYFKIQHCHVSMIWEDIEKYDINHERFKTICKVRASKAACKKDQKIKDVMVWTSRTTQQFWKCFPSHMSLCTWLSIFYFLQRTNQAPLKMLSLPHRISCSYQVGDKTSVVIKLPWFSTPQLYLFQYMLSNPKTIFRYKNFLTHC